MFSEDLNAAAISEHAARTSHLSEDEKKIYNDGYLWASGDALVMIRGVLDDNEMSAEEKVEVLDLVAVQASLPLLIAGIATGKDYLSE